METATKKVLKVELIQVEMPSNDNLDCEIFFKSTSVKTIEDAEKAQIIASPTIRVGNLDFYPNHATDKSEKREWTWNSLTTSEPTKETLIEVLLKGYFEPKKELEKMEMSAYILQYLNKEMITSSDCSCS